VAEEQDSSPPSPPGDQEETASSHTIVPPRIKGDVDASGNTNSPRPPSTHPVIDEQTPIADQVDVVMHDVPEEIDTDLLARIRGLYRLLDLINEQGSGGAGMIKVPHCYIIKTQLTSFPSGQDHHRSRFRGDAYERYLPRCLYFHDKGEYHCLRIDDKSLPYTI
jgi:hypothetical protein